MWKVNNCGCKSFEQEPLEYEILDSLKYEIPKLLSKEIDTEELKRKIICEYLGIINNLECGSKPDLEFILEEISLVDINDGTYRIL